MKKRGWERRLAAGSLAICIAGLAAVFLISPGQAVSRPERRRLAARPKLTAESLLDKSFMDGTEKYLLDHFPVRDWFRRVKAYFAYGILMQKENNGIYVAEGHASRLEYPLNAASVNRLADKMAALRRQYFPEREAWYAIVPDKNYFLAGANGYPAMDYGLMEESLSQALAGTGGGFCYIDIISGLDIDDYYRTDTHWRQERIPGTAGTILQAMGNDAPLRGTDFEAHEVRDFYGVYYGQAALPMEPDTIVYLTNEAVSAASVWNLEENISAPVYRLDKLESAESLDYYDIFAGGAAALQIIRSPKAPADKRLFIFRDSYASSLAPLFLETYGEIVLVDLRYISSALIGPYVDFADADILFLYSVAVINQSSMLK